MDISSRAVQARLGSVFVLAVGASIAAGTTVLTPKWDHLSTATAVGAIDLTIAVTSIAVPWQRFPPRALLAFPLLMVATVAALGLCTTGSASPLLALLTVSVLYVGLTQQRGSTLRMLPLITSAWWLAYQTHGLSVLASLPLWLAVWIAVGEMVSLYRTQEVQRAAALATEAETDPLTGLANRRRLDRSLATTSDGVTVLYIDLDHFKGFNDEHGHVAGDQLLQAFGGVLQASVRGDDLAIRVGGEEFMVLTESAVDGSHLDQRIRRAWHDVEPHVTYSSGAASQQVGEYPSATMRRADEALYTAKALGRDMLVVDDHPQCLTVDLPSAPVVPIQTGPRTARDGQRSWPRLPKVG